MLVSMRTSGDLSGRQGGGFFAPCVLMMIQAGVWDTAQLRELLTAFGFSCQVDALEETLGQLERDTLVYAEHGATADDAHGGGPPRWGLTPGGEEWLAARCSVLAEPGRLVSRFLQRYPGLDAAGQAADSNDLIHSESPRDRERHGVSRA